MYWYPIQHNTCTMLFRLGVSRVQIFDISLSDKVFETTITIQSGNGTRDHSDSAKLICFQK